MRLSVLTLFIALPAAAYAAVHPRQSNTCLSDGEYCKYDWECCRSCRNIGAGLFATGVCLMVHFL